MADDNPVQSLCDETKCPICLEYFKDPAMIGCGHNFCQACISQCWGEAEETEASCPYCKNVVPSRDVKANTSLASIVEIAKRFRVQTSRVTEPPGGFCNRHREPLKLFCEDDQALVCVVCDRSTQHRGHRVIPAEEAWEKYKDLLMLRLSDLRDRKQELLDSEMRFPLENLKLQELKENDIRKLFAEFKELHQFLEEEECRLQIQMKELDHTVKDMENKHIARLSEGISSVDRCIEELEEKQKQPVYDFLPDIGKTLERYSIWQCPVPSFSELRQEIEKISIKLSSLKPIMKKFKDAVLLKMEGSSNEDIEIPKLALSRQQTKLLMFQRSLECWSYIMGAERITSGRHSWIAHVGDEPFWAVGVARKQETPSSIRIWGIEKDFFNLCVSFTSGSIVLGQEMSVKARTLHPMPSRIRVVLNYDHRSIAFFDADKNKEIFAFTEVPLKEGEELCSWHSVAVAVPLRRTGVRRSPKSDSNPSPDREGYRIALPNNKNH